MGQVPKQAGENKKTDSLVVHFRTPEQAKEVLHMDLSIESYMHRFKLFNPHCRYPTLHFRTITPHHSLTSATEKPQRSHPSRLDYSVP